MDNQFTVQNAIDTLRNNELKMRGLGNELYKLRVEHTKAMLDLHKKENEARQKYFKKEVDVRVSELRDWLKLETYIELAREQELADQIRIKREALDTLEQLTNLNKFIEKLQHLNINF